MNSIISTKPLVPERRKRIAQGNRNTDSTSKIRKSRAKM